MLDAEPNRRSGIRAADLHTNLEAQPAIGWRLRFYLYKPLLKLLKHMKNSWL